MTGSLITLRKKILREHTAQHEFSLRLKEIYQQDETRAKKLLALCARLEFIDHLSYSARIDVPPTARNTARAEYQLSRLIIYLTTTCVDIAANEIYGGTLARRFLPDTCIEPPFIYLNHKEILMRMISPLSLVFLRCYLLHHTQIMKYFLS